MNRFTQKVVVVTGAGSGIGEATAKRFAREGASVVLVGRNEDKLKKVHAQLEGEGHVVRAADVADLSDVEALFKEVASHFGRLDVLVNNAGIVKSGKVTELEVQDWKELMSVDLDGVFYCTRSAMPALIVSKGNIVNVSSVSGMGGDWGMSFYNAAKGAITNFTRALALDHGADGVRVNAVCPSLTRSELTDDMMDNDALMAKFKERIALGRPAEPEDIGDVIAFLASDDARFVTGVNLPVDGGLSASNGQPPQA
ncbi:MULTISPECIES: SDR family NAD(P)-dependent oxidoreductase [Pseudomonas syringae group]|uniref:Short-chain dehydrogenase n=1 Tax=Pseudomonas syringae pv. ribicola TaxID=55398 RepID=A0A0P9Z3N3_PSESI|nr:MULTISPECIES: SDR family oxidoreductase [Pseudomonas syringae group]EKN46086.1 short-chain dehydrogenase [Pseudomonas viridiflava UASWS0038]KPL64234.1 3-oxoacyl-ACP reductase [Pseudomonas viridiflava]KPY46163.1 Short-chain dehydrogenase [Pseudomonas syringae pv. ribicola]KPZ24716.1 Short-chain dehydrogenase [Pseudomonas viridiflava]OAG89555.1 3-oxoacyl-ACP reductase [Pseudomonas viridiflava]